MQVEIKLNNIPITIAAFYFPPIHKITAQHYFNYFISICNNYIIDGDFNAKQNSWGCRANNPRGLVLHNFVSQHNLKVLAPPDPIYWPTSTRKYPGILDIFIAKIPGSIQFQAKLFNGTTNKLNFHEIVDQQIKLNVKLKSNDDLDSVVNNLTNII